jgi:hypothetical protein
MAWDEIFQRWDPGDQLLLPEGEQFLGVKQSAMRMWQGPRMLNAEKIPTQIEGRCGKMMILEQMEKLKGNAFGCGSEK